MQFVSQIILHYLHGCYFVRRICARSGIHGWHVSLLMTDATNWVKEMVHDLGRTTTAIVWQHWCARNVLCSEQHLISDEALFATIVVVELLLHQ